MTRPAATRAAARYGAPVSAVAGLMLAGPTVMAFFSGGYFDESRNWAGVVAWACVALALLARAPWPRARAVWVALAGLAGLAAWTLCSILWAPLAGNAYHAGQLAFLYLGALLAVTLHLGRSRAVRSAIEPVLLTGTVVVIGYGLSERLVPGVLHFAHSVSAEGRLEQPLTYWNATGELAAIGLVLAARLGGDLRRPAALRCAALAATGPLGLGLYLSFSRGALFAALVGLLALVMLAPNPTQLRALAVSTVAAVLASAGAAWAGGVTEFAGGLGERESQGAIVLAILAALAALAALATRRLVIPAGSRRLTLPRHAGVAATALVCAGLAVTIVVGAKESSRRPLSSDASRYVSLQSSRYAYWDVAMRAFSQQPLHGVGAGNWSVYWLRYRHFGEFAADAHSLPVQTLAELGVVGLALLAMFLAGLTAAARIALRRSPAAAAGPIAGGLVYLLHSPLDWDWQMPAVTLLAIGLGGALLSLAGFAERPGRPDPSAYTGGVPVGPQS